MRANLTKRIFRPLLCVLLCIAMAVPLMGAAQAADSGSEEQNITIRITPPQSWTEGSAAVEIRITDNAGAGFLSAQVKRGSGSWRDVTAELEQTENRWYCVTDITENCTVYVRVTGLDGTVYEKSAYIQCFNTVSDHRTEDVGQSDSADAAPMPSPAPQPSAGPATPPGGQGTVIDYASDGSDPSEESGKEFFTISTPDENVFYLIIDRERESENVYFLNAVTESDLMALAEKDGDSPDQSDGPAPVCTCAEKCVPGAVDAGCPVCILSWKDCAGLASASGDGAAAQTEPEESGGGMGAIILVLVAALAVGGAGYYLKIYKPKKELADADDFEDLTGGVEEPVVNEDDLPAAMPYAEPDEPDYPEDYEDDM